MLFLTSKTKNVEEEDEFSMAMPKKRGRSPCKALLGFISRGKEMTARLRSSSKPSKIAAQTTSHNFDEEDDASTVCDADYVKSSDCILLDGLCDQYLGGQRQHRHSKDYYNVRYFNVENPAWPAAPEDTQSSMSTYRSYKPTAARTAPAVTDTAVSPAVTSRSSIISL
eukprot:TRINITY_DN28038_c0_g1_i1.p1 TRINITY_DN28038_c0_g1~~TRINITY_DN28038_c0_g1_i1.p1  ORF type:complete len:168 (+),score=43.70 TRINITY_DN28038_c0_g1_i1:100-603(+)